MENDYDITRHVRERLSAAGIDFSSLSWAATETAVEGAAVPIREEMERLRRLLRAYIRLEESAAHLLPYLPDSNDAKNYAATNDGRASNFHVASLRLRTAIQDAKNANIGCGQMDRDAAILAQSNWELLRTLKAALPNLEWANIHGSRCEEILSQVKAAIQKAES